MLTQLLKHEFKATRRIVPWIYLVTVMMILTNLAVRPLDIGWLTSLLLVLLILSAIAEILMTYVLTFYRYYKNLYNSEGYLMHTLPVRPVHLLISKVIISFGWLLTSYLIMLGVVLTTALIIAGDAGLRLKDILDQAIAGTGLSRSSVSWLIVALFFYLCLSILYLMAQVFFAITAGNTARFHPMGVGGPIIFFIAAYMAGQICILAGMILIPLGVSVQNQSLRIVPRSMLATLVNPEDFVFGLGSILSIILVTVGLFIFTERLIRRSTSLR